jgi:hypothetical protein
MFFPNLNAQRTQLRHIGGEAFHGLAILKRGDPSCTKVVYKSKRWGKVTANYAAHGSGTLPIEIGVFCVPIFRAKKHPVSGAIAFDEYRKPSIKRCQMTEPVAHKDRALTIRRAA